LILVSKEKMEELGLKPLARIVSYADAAQAPEDFTTAPAKLYQLLLKSRFRAYRYRFLRI
jgi:acetyl-CoA C-acetyltransferase